MRISKYIRIMGMMFALFLLSLGQISNGQPGNPLGPDDIFLKASREYRMGRYDEAIAQYQLLLQEGIESGSLFYNLGNCFFKKGQLGRAILNYERARKIIPSDSDLRTNYQYATSLIKTAPGDTIPWYEKLFERIFGGLTINGLILFLSIMYILSMVLLILRIYLTGMSRLSNIAIAILIAFFVLGSLSLYGNTSSLGKEAITLIERADVRYEPFERAPVHFILYEGMKIRIVQTRENWIKIRGPNQKTGWVPASAIETI